MNNTPSNEGNKPLLVGSLADELRTRYGEIK